VETASDGFRIDLSGFETRVWGRGRRGELWGGTNDCEDRPLPFAGAGWASKLTFFFLLEDRRALDGMPLSDDGEVWGVFRSALAAISLATGSFVPKGSLRKSRTSSASGSASWMSLGGVGGRTERDSNLELENTMAMLENNHARAKTESRSSAGIAHERASGEAQASVGGWTW
jgi:hypothetical protein